jgi:signal transduction histidine kinase
VQQYRSEGVEFAGAPPPAGTRVPRVLFDNVADNLIRNALAKRAGADDSVAVRVRFDVGAELQLRVCDSGAAIPAEQAGTLLRAPSTTGAGLGIGLYQAARLSESRGYRLRLESNLDGQVCFVLSGPLP